MLTLIAITYKLKRVPSNLPKSSQYTPRVVTGEFFYSSLFICPPTPGPGGFWEGFVLPELGLRPRGGGHFRFFENFSQLCPIAEGVGDLKMIVPRKNFALWVRGGKI